MILRLGALIGVVISHLLLGILSISVDAVLISFAGSPDEFEKNHPSMCHDMRSAWRETWPGTVDYIVKSSSHDALIIDEKSFYYDKVHSRSKGLL